MPGNELAPAQASALVPHADGCGWRWPPILPVPGHLPRPCRLRSALLSRVVRRARPPARISAISARSTSTGVLRVAVKAARRCWSRCLRRLGAPSTAPRTTFAGEAVQRSRLRFLTSLEILLRGPMMLTALAARSSGLVSGLVLRGNRRIRGWSARCVACPPRPRRRPPLSRGFLRVQLSWR